VPQEYQAFQSKPEIALSEIDRMIAAGMRFACILADAAYGLSARFCQGLSARGLAWAVGIPRHQKVYPADGALIFPLAGCGRPRKRHLPDQLSVAAAVMLAKADWRSVSWRRGTKGKLSAQFAALQVRVADRPTQRIGEKGAQHMPGEVVWLVGEHRASGERKYYLSNLPADTDLTALAAAIKARWVCEQAHQQLKEELGLDHFEGRSWTGLRRHALMTLIAFAFLQHQRLAAAGRGKKRRPTAASAKPASSAASPSRSLGAPVGIAGPLPALPTPAHGAAASTQSAKVMLERVTTCHSTSSSRLASSARRLRN
jgi:SRSO17 transposase